MMIIMIITIMIIQIIITIIIMMMIIIIIIIILPAHSFSGGAAVPVRAPLTLRVRVFGKHRGREGLQTFPALPISLLQILPLPASVKKHSFRQAFDPQSFGRDCSPAPDSVLSI